MSPNGTSSIPPPLPNPPKPKPVSIMSSKRTQNTFSTSEERANPPQDDSKTPRRVQWLDDTSDPVPHTLDEEGLDPEAFQTLTGALERHQSERHDALPGRIPSPPHPIPPPRIHYFGSKPPAPALTIDPMNRGPSEPPLPRKFEPISASTTISDSSMSYPPTATDSPEEQHIDLPGQFIDRNENSGLPATRDAEADAQKEAANIVRAHTRGRRRHGIFGMPHKKDRRSVSVDSHDGLRRRKNSTKHRDYVETDRLEDIEAAKDSYINPPLPAGGLLSALLALYNDDSSIHSGMSTPGTTVPRHDRSMKPGGLVKEVRPRPNSPGPSPSLDLSRISTGKSEPSSPTSEKSSPSRPLSATLEAGQALFDDIFRPRPPAARNAGGVFGSLIASTGNITGVAAPTVARVGPNVTRPGYKLTRYSLEDVPKRKMSKHSSHHPAMSLDASTSSSALELSEMRQRPASESFNTPITTPPGLPPQPLRSPYAYGTMSAQSSSQTLSPPTTGYRSKWSGVIKDFPPSTLRIGTKSGRSTPSGTPGTTPGNERDDFFSFEDSTAKERHADREKRRKRKKAEIYITRHVAEIIQRQGFLCKLARAMMMFGGPSHRFPSQIQSCARVLDIEVSCMYLPDVMLISFDDASTGTSQIKFIKQGSALDLGKLSDAYLLYWKVIHDEISVSEASGQLDDLMRKPQIYNLWQLMLIGGMCSSSICSVSFNGSFIDSLVVFPLGALLVGIQIVSVRNELYSNVFEITITTLFSFLSAFLASSKIFCYSAIASSSVVLILPGFIVLCGSLEIMSRNIVSGSVRMFYAVIYSLFLGFGLATGAQAYEKITQKSIVGITDYTCSESHSGGPWYRKTPPLWWAFMTVPFYSTFLSMRLLQPWKRKEMPLLIIISCAGWATNHFSSLKFINQSDFSAAAGAFAVGFIANLWARFFSGNAFVIMITGILFQLPSGLGNGGLLGFVSDQSSGSSSSTSYLSGFQTGLQLISVAIGLTVGLGISLFLVHPVPSRRRQGGVFSL